MVAEQEFVPMGTPGVTTTVACGPLELATSTRVNAAQADGLEVDVLHWALPGEAVAIAAARGVLRRFVSPWWRA